MTPRSSLRSMTEMLELIDWDALPAEAKATIRQIGPLLTAGFRPSEISEMTGISAGAVKNAIDQLREALLVQTGELEGRLREHVAELHRRRYGR